MKKLLSYLKPYTKECLLAPLFKLLEAIFELLVPLVVVSLIDIGIANSDKPYIIKMTLVLVLLAAVGVVSACTAQYFSAKAAVGFAKTAKQGLFKHIQTLSATDHDKIGQATLITRLTSDMDKMQSGVNLFLRLLLRSPFIVFGAAIMAFMVDWKAAILFVIIIPILTLVIYLLMYFSIPLYKKVQEKLDGVLRITRENLVGARVIRAFNRGESEQDEFNAQNAFLYKTQKVAGVISALMNPVTMVVVNLGIIALIYTGAIRVSVGILTQGAVIALVNYMNQILVELIKLINLIITLSRALSSGKRIEEIFNKKPSIEEGNIGKFEDSDVAIEFKNVNLRYYEDRANILNDISFSLNKGETLGIIGPTGSGKSSLAQLMIRLYEVTDGSVELMGHNVKDYTFDAIRSNVSYALQETKLFKGSIKDNILFGNLSASEEEIEKALAISQAKEFVDKKGLDSLVEQGGKNLSGGQKQRLSIARAIIKNPKLLILDDSTSALDFRTEANLKKAIKEMDLTQVIISQRASSVMHADLILVLDNGVIVGKGKHEELLLNCPLYEEIYSIQHPKEKGGSNE